MLEIPESFTMAEQLNQMVKGKIIKNVTANSSPHKFAFYFGDPGDYHQLLSGKKVGEAKAVAGFVEIEAEDTRILFSDGANIRFYAAGVPIPQKHQLHIEFSDDSSIVCTISMYGGLWAYRQGENENKYYLTALEKPSPLTNKFDQKYFSKLLKDSKKSMSVKAFLATEQRIPGLGNGVLQDILFNAGIHPRTTLESLSEDEKTNLFLSVKSTLLNMTKQGGRDTEKDLFGNSGNYRTQMSNNKMDKPCPECGGAILRQAYMGGNVYFCPKCQQQKK